MCVGTLKMMITLLRVGLAVGAVVIRLRGLMLGTACLLLSTIVSRLVHREHPVFVNCLGGAPPPLLHRLFPRSDLRFRGGCQFYAQRWKYSKNILLVHATVENTLVLAHSAVQAL